MVDNLVMPETLSVGFKGGPTFSTDKVVAVNMQERRLQNLSIARHVYSFMLDNAAASTVTTLRAFWFDRRGDFKAFLFKDWADYQLTAEQIAIGDGSTVAFQATKTYSAGSNPYVRIIRYIKSGTLVVKVNGVTKTLTVDYTVNSTGLITFVSAPANASLITIDGEFYVPVRFEGDAFSTILPNQGLAAISVDGLQAIEVIP
jgi:uncharacterized protein (TIGR02217 family)